MAELEIMREVEEWLTRYMVDNKIGVNVVGEIKIDSQQLLPMMEEFLRREIVRVLIVEREKMNKEADGEYGHNTADGLEEAMQILTKTIAKYSPKPQYCPGMQEAIEANVFYIRKDGKCFDAGGNWVRRCCYCEEGKNCLGDNK